MPGAATPAEPALRHKQFRNCNTAASRRRSDQLHENCVRCESRNLKLDGSERTRCNHGEGAHVELTGVGHGDRRRKRRGGAHKAMVKRRLRDQIDQNEGRRM